MRRLRGTLGRMPRPNNPSTAPAPAPLRPRPRSAAAGAAALLQGASMVFSWWAGPCGTLELADGLFNAAHAVAALAIGGGVHLGWDVMLIHFRAAPGECHGISNSAAGFKAAVPEGQRRAVELDGPGASAAGAAPGWREAGPQRLCRAAARARSA